MNVNERVAALLAQMTVEEKLAQLGAARMSDFLDFRDGFAFDAEAAKRHVPLSVGYLGRIGGASDLAPQELARRCNEIQRHFVEHTRLGIPVLFMTEATSGVLSRSHTLFPMNLAAGAMFDPDLVREMGDAIRQEMLATGERWALAPVVDVIRDPRYGRFEESFGEDVLLCAANGIAFTRGLQSDDLSRGIAATLKHFVAQGISDGGRNTAPVHLGDRELLDQYAAPFEAVIREAAPATVMAAYHELDGMPCHISRPLLRDLLRERLGFDGLLVSDGNGIGLVKDHHDYCETYGEAARLTFEAGIECELDHIWRSHLPALVANGTIPMEALDAAVSRMLSLKFQLGLFDRPYVEEAAAAAIVGAPAHEAVTGRMAREAVTLLRNEGGLLPLSPACRTIAVIGPLADRKEFAYGDYSYPSHVEDMFLQSENLSEEEAIARTLFFARKGTTYDDLFQGTETVLEAVRRLAPSAEVLHAPGLLDTWNYRNRSDFQDFGPVRAACARADVVIAVCGDTSGMGYENDSGESVDRATIGLSEDQRALLAVALEAGKPVVLVLANGRPLELSWEAARVHAIVEAWRPGNQGASAIAEVLFGRICPGGRLPVTLPKCLGQLPVYYSQRPTGHRQFWRQTYLETDLAPLYPFGYGLSYTTFAYDAIEMQQETDRIRIRFALTNTGTMEGDEVVQLYARKRHVSVVQPSLELKAFRRIRLSPGGTVRVEAELLLDTLAFHDASLACVLESMDLEVSLGRNAADLFATQAFRIEVEGGSRIAARRTMENPVRVIG